MPFYAQSEETISALDPGAPVPPGGDSPVLDYLSGVWQDPVTVSRARTGPASEFPDTGGTPAGPAADGPVVVEIEVP